MKSEAVDEQDAMPSTEDTPAQEMHLLEILIILARRRKFVLWFTSITTILTAIIVFIVPNKYTAVTVVLPPSQNSSMSAALLSQFAGTSNLASLAGASLGIKNQGDMYVSLFRSRTVEDAVIQRFGLMARYHKKTMIDARASFERRTAAVLGVKDGLIRISVTDRDPNFAARVANAYVEEFHKHTDSLATTEASQRRVFFQQQLLEASANLTRAEEALKSTESSTGVLQLDSQARALVESAAVLRGQITAKEVELHAMRAYATENNPQVIVAQHELDAMKAQLAKVAGTDNSSDSSFAIAGSKIPEAGMEYMNKLRDVRYYETIDELIAKQFEAAKLDEARQAVIQVVDVAIPPDKKSGPYRAFIIVLFAILSFAIAAGWSLFSERLERSLRDPQQGPKLRELCAIFSKER